MKIEELRADHPETVSKVDLMANDTTVTRPIREPSQRYRELARQVRLEEAKAIREPSPGLLAAMRATALSAAEAVGKGLDELPARDICGRLHDGLSFDDWAKLGQSLQKQTQQLAWVWGDWWAFGEHRYGERTKLVTAPEWRGPSLRVLENYASVARAFEQTSRRREVLTFSHHVEVSSVEPAIADRLLKRAAKEKWSTRVLREKAAKLKPRSTPPALPSPRPSWVSDPIEDLVKLYLALSPEDQDGFLRRINCCRVAPASTCP